MNNKEYKLQNTNSNILILFKSDKPFDLMSNMFDSSELDSNLSLAIELTFATEPNVAKLTDKADISELLSELPHVEYIITINNFLNDITVTDNWEYTDLYGKYISNVNITDDLEAVYQHLISRVSSLSAIKYKTPVLQLTDENHLQSILNDFNTRPDNIISIDFETNGEDRFFDGFYVTCIGLSETLNSGESKGYYLITPVTSNYDNIFNNILLPFLLENSHRVYTFNVSFEISVIRHYTNKFVPLQDILVLATSIGKRANLKTLAKNELGVDDWEKKLKNTHSLLEKLFKRITRAKVKLPISSLTDLKPQLNSTDELEELIKEFGEVEILEGINHYPSVWASSPKTMLGTYCALDACYTGLLYYKFVGLPGTESYPVLIKHPYLASKFETYGPRWDDKKLEELRLNTIDTMITLLYEVIMFSSIPEEDKLEAQSIYSRTLPYDIIWYTEKTKQERRKTVNSKMDKLDHLKTFVNLTSNTKESRAKFWDNYLTEEIKLATLLTIFIEEVELYSKVPNEIKESILPLDYYDSTTDEVLGKLSEIQSNNNTIVGKSIAKHLSISINKLSEFTHRYAADIIKFQYKVHDEHLNLDINNKETWSKEFKVLFNVFLFKKLDKMQSTGISGTGGRQSVYSIKSFDTEHPIRHQKYSANKDMYILNNSFNSLAASTLRWTSGWHVLPAGSPVRRGLMPYHDDEFWCFTGDTEVKTYQGNITILEIIEKLKRGEKVSSFSIDENGELKTAEIGSAYKTKDVDQTIKLEFDDGSIVECTLNHRFMLEDGGYIEAKDINEFTELKSIYN